MSSVHPVGGLSVASSSYSTTSFEMAVQEDNGMRKPSTSVFTKSEAMESSYKWQEWSMMNSSKTSSVISITGILFINGFPLNKNVQILFDGF